MHRKFVALTLTVALIPALARAADPPWVARSRVGMVASDSPEASQIGAAVLARGGNAFDAAVATSFALAVARPQSTGLGGGGFMLAYLAQDQRLVALDFRENAPAGATAERYAKLHAAAGTGPSPSVYGGHAVGVPGQLAGLDEIHRRCGSLSWEQLVQPAIDLAQAGFVVDEHYRKACRSALDDYEKWPQLAKKHGRLHQTLLGAGAPPPVGARVTRPDLTRALRLIAEDGPDTVYGGGPLGAAIARAVETAGGLLTTDDLARYEVRERQPVQATYHEYEIIAMPPPSSGGVCLLEALNILDAAAPRPPGRWRAMGRDRCAPTLVHALKHAFADRARWLGDPDYATVPVDRLISRAYAGELARKPTDDLDDFGSTQLPEDGGTSHLCAADRHGNVVALTETINGTFGALVVAEPFGIILNNQMDDFATNPGQPNLYGLIQGAANAVAPGKRPLSSMAPTLVFKGTKPVLVLGGSGGPRIITSVLQVLLNVIEFGLPLDEALTVVRLHHQWRPDEVYFDRAPPAELLNTLQTAGCRLSERRKTGVVQAIQFLEDGTMVGACDPRKGGRPAGVRADPPQQAPQKPAPDDTVAAPDSELALRFAFGVRRYSRFAGAYPPPPRLTRWTSVCADNLMPCIIPLRASRLGAYSIAVSM